MDKTQFAEQFSGQISNQSSQQLRERYGRVAVLAGGNSAERAVSLDSGQCVFDTLAELGLQVTMLDPVDGLIDEIGNIQVYDRVFNCLHGGAGEDGRVQAVLDDLGLPYTGTGLLGSAINMDKLTAKAVFAQAGLPVLPHHCVTSMQQLSVLASELVFPVAVKPNNGGSSVGVSKVTSVEALPAAVELAQNYSKYVLIERWLPGQELSLPVFAGQVYPIVDIQVSTREFYDYIAKTGDSNTQFICPCEGLGADQVQFIQSVALKAYEISYCSGLARVDFRLDEAGKPWLFEVNTLPGLTKCSLSPCSFKAAGINFAELLLLMLDDTV